MMKIVSFLVILFVCGKVHAQNGSISTEDFKWLTEFEGNQVAFKYDDVVESYIYTTQTFFKPSTNIINPTVKVKAYLKLKKVDDTYCFSAIHFGVNLVRQGKGYNFDSLHVIIGFATNIKNGDATVYKFVTKADSEGDAQVGGDQVEEIISKSIATKRPISFYFFDKGVKTADYMIPYAKVGQKFGGIIKTRNNLTQKFVICED